MSEAKPKPDFRLLMTGDLHIGRSSSRVPDGVSADSLRAATAWERIVNLAIEQQVNAVLLSGDITDAKNKFWEAIGPLEEGVERLTTAGIHPIAVAGNHDYEVLGRLADQLKGRLKLLGARQEWERITLNGQSGPALHIDGWSFAAPHVEQSPLDDYEPNPDSDVPVLGMVHGDLDASASHYAPLDRARLEAAGPNAWLLGHVHKPQLSDGDSWILYPGSPQALDFGEAGRHGPWIADVRNGRIERPEQVQLSTVWYDSLAIDANAINHGDELRSEIKLRVDMKAAEIAAAAGTALEQIILRLRIHGRSKLAGTEQDSLTAIEEDFRLPVGSATLTVDRARSELLPDIDLEQNAQLPNVLGTVASLLLALDRDERSPELESLIEQTRQDMEQVAARKDFLRVTGYSITADEVVEHLRDTGRDLLIQLLNQTNA